MLSSHRSGGIFFLALTVFYCASASTYLPDKEALLQFKASVEDFGYILGGWSNYTDPCIDKWRGVSCTCFPFFDASGAEDRALSCYPLEPYLAEEGSRVLQLNLGDVRITDWNTLEGELPAAIGNLTELRVLNLAGNNFTGPIPQEWEALGELEILTLTNNKISGPLPGYLSEFQNLRYVHLENNSFSGPIPPDWCRSKSWWMFDIRHNPGLCNEVPWCLEDRLVTFEGTSLIDAISDQDQGLGGYCDIPLPACNISLGQCQINLPDPPYWTSPNRVSFSFPNFPASDGGAASDYKWKVCISNGNCITDWIDYKGKDLTRSASIIDPESNEEIIVSQLVHVVDTDLPIGITLSNGIEYSIKILGYNAAGVLNGVEVTSGNILADTTKPSLPSGKSVYSGQYFSNVAAQVTPNGMGVSWDSFEDPESGIQGYYFQIFEYLKGSGVESYIGSPQTPKIRAGGADEQNVYASNLNLAPGKAYFARVTAVNGAGIQASSDSAPVSIVVPGEGIVIETTTSGVKVSNLVIVLAVVGSVLVFLFLAILYFLRKRYRKKQKANKKHRGQLRTLRQLLTNMSTKEGNQENDKFRQLNQLKHVTFVFTDLENSTGIASAAPRAYEWVQSAHDNLMRDLIAACGAYEINTEGDAFQVAFKDVTTAVQFCMDIQYEMMEIEWPREVLKLSGCEAVYSKTGRHWIYKGPRIRMGIHWANEGDIVQQFHSITKHRIFSGSAFEMARDLCEAANGGQVLLSHAVWESLRTEMRLAGFPVLEQLGSYMFKCSSRPVWVYQVRSLIGRPLQRPILPSAGILNGSERLHTGTGLNIIPAPVPINTKGELSFVTIRISHESISNVGEHECIPSGVLDAVHESLLVCAMQYEGYAFRLSPSGYFMFSFASCVNALKMSHAVQMVVMSVSWPSECQDWCGKEEVTPDGKLLYKGPRLAIGIHQSNDYSIRPVPLTKPTPEDICSLTDYLGPGEEISREIADSAHGGQVILSEAAWSAVQDKLPGGPTVISLGSHLLEASCFTGPAMLMEVMPQQLNKRTFPRPRNATMVEPGYRDAPSAQSVVTIVHLRVVKPRIVVESEKMRNKTPGEHEQIMAAYSKGVSMAAKIVRQLLREFGGYECKEPHPGRFTVAFEDFEASLRWSAATQTALLSLDWSKDILSWPECKEAHHVSIFTPLDCSDSESNLDDTTLSSEHAEWKEKIEEFGQKLDYPKPQVIWRGLKAKIGIASGLPLSKAPLNTGRADYYGIIPNLAARLVSIAHPGQILFDAARLDSLQAMHWQGDTAFLRGTNSLYSTSSVTESIELCPIGQLKIKGMDELRSVFQALPWSLRRREFPESPAMVRPVIASSITRRMASLRKASEASTGNPNINKSLSKTSSVSRSRDSGSTFFKIFAPRTGKDTLTQHTTNEHNSDGPYSGILAPHDLQHTSATHSEVSMYRQDQRLLNMIDAQAKNSESSLPTTPKSIASIDKSNPAHRSPDKRKPSRMCNDLPSPIPEQQSNMRHSDGQYGSLCDMKDWEGSSSMVKTPSAMSKVVDHWDTSMAMEALYAETERSQGHLSDAKDLMNDPDDMERHQEDDTASNHSPAPSSFTTDSMMRGQSAVYGGMSRKSRIWYEKMASATGYEDSINHPFVYSQCHETQGIHNSNGQDEELHQNSKDLSSFWTPLKKLLTRKASKSQDIGKESKSRVF